MSTIDSLTKIFREFPGIGPRQAARFVYYLLTRQKGYLENLAHLILDLKKGVRVCTSCQRFFSDGKISTALCEICRDTSRDQKTLMIVSKDIDLENVEKAHSYNGLYFILGGTVPILEKEPERKVRARELSVAVTEKMKGGLSEIILAMNLNPEGENTGEYVVQLLSPIAKGIKISTLGRGLSTGTELEYSDAETIKNALRNRG